MEVMPSAEFTEPLTFLMGDYELPAPVHTPAWHHYTKIYDSWNRCDMYVMNGLNNARIDTGNTLMYYIQDVFGMNLMADVLYMIH